MKLIIQIPAFNEAVTLPSTIANLPRSVDGFEAVECLVIDDGSSDGTLGAAQAAGAQHVVRHTKNMGLARAFETGLRAALALGADVIVNTDADNQYCADDIGKLVRPILTGDADMVIGERPISSISHFSPIKKFLQKAGSAVVRLASGTSVRDAPSGFRAFSRSAAQNIRVFSKYTYTLETIIQAGQKGLAIASVPIRVNSPTRESRLIRSLPAYILRSSETIIRIFVTYRPLRFFALLATVFATPGLLLSFRFLYFFLTGRGQGMIQSLILAAMLITVGFLLLVVGLLADLIAVNRNLLERSEFELRQLAEQVQTSTPTSRHPGPTAPQL